MQFHIITVVEVFFFILLTAVFLVLPNGSYALTQSGGAASSSSSSSTNNNIPFSPSDAKLTQIAIAGGDLQSQSIPLGYASKWPVWITSSDGKTVTRIPSDDDDGGGWVNPVTFEQLWLPLDLPPPTSRYALGVVLKDGTPRYIFPTIETLIATSDGGAWHNRGMNSLAIGKTWLPFGDIPFESLRMSCYKRPLPNDDEEENEKKAGNNNNDESVEEDDNNKKGDDSPPWTPVLPLTKVIDSINMLFDVISKGPDDMGDGFCYLIMPLSSLLPKDAVTPGKRVRLFLSNVETMPTSQDPDDDKAWMWNRGECDISIYNVAPGGESEFLPAAYKPLYNKEQCS